MSEDGTAIMYIDRLVQSHLTPDCHATTGLSLGSSSPHLSGQCSGEKELFSEAFRAGARRMMKRRICGFVGDCKVDSRSSSIGL
jgi:hypothetical protein